MSWPLAVASPRGDRARRRCSRSDDHSSTGIMWLWLLALVGVVGLNLLVPVDSWTGVVVKWMTLAGCLAFLVVFPIGRSASTLLDMGLFAVFGIVCIGTNLVHGFAGKVTLAQAAFLGIGAYVSVLFDTGREIAVGGIDHDASEPAVPARDRHRRVDLHGLQRADRVPGAARAGPVVGVRDVGVQPARVPRAQQRGGAHRGIARDQDPARRRHRLRHRPVRRVATTTTSASRSWSLATALVWWIVRSPWGRAFKALRDNPARAASLGVDIRTYTLLAFSISAGLAGVAGALYARLIEFVDPRGFYIGQSFDFFLATVVGGLGTLVGPFIGVSFITVLTDRLRIAGDYYRVWFGLFVVVMMLVAPKGVAGSFNQLRATLQKRRRDKDTRRHVMTAIEDGADVDRHATKPKSSFGFATSPSRSAGSGRSTTCRSISGRARSSASSGPNGCGKTTLFNCILGQYRPDAGRVELHGRDVSRWRPHRRAKAGLARTFQLLQVFESMSVRDNLRTAAQEHIGSMGRRLFQRPGHGPRRRDRPAHRAVPPRPSRRRAGRQPQLRPAEAARHGDGVRVADRQRSSSTSRPVASTRRCSVI